MPALIPILKGFLAFLAPMLMELVFKIFLGLGISFVSYQGLSLAVQGILDNFTSSYLQIPEEIVGFIGLAGIPEAFNIILGGFSFSFGIWSTYKTMKFLNKG